MGTRGLFYHHRVSLEIPLVNSKAGVELENIREHRSFSHYFQKVGGGVVWLAV